MMPAAEAEALEARIDRLTFGAGHSPAVLRKGKPAQLKDIVVATDGSEASEHALAWATELATRFASRLRLVTVAPSTMSYVYAQGAPLPPDALRFEEDAARKVLEDAERALRPLHRGFETHLACGEPVDQVVRLAEREHADLVVVGSHGRGAVGRLLLGSVADGVKHRAPASVLIAKGPTRPREVLVATDGSALSKRAAALGVQLAEAWGAHVTILHAVPPPSFGPLEDAERTFEAAFGGLGLPWDLPKVTFDLQFGHPAERIVETARARGCGLILMGSRGLGGVENLLAGSVSNRVAHEAPCSVLLVKEGS